MAEHTIAITTGNLDERVRMHPETGGWVLGSFMEKYPEFLCDDAEIKWARHPQGHEKRRLSATVPVRTIEILIQGKFQHTFPESGRKVVMKKLGDFVMYDASTTSHISTALEDSLILVVRTPSKRDR